MTAVKANRDVSPTSRTNICSPSGQIALHSSFTTLLADINTIIRMQAENPITIGGTNTNIRPMSLPLVQPRALPIENIKVIKTVWAKMVLIISAVKQLA
jgi:hypothetical protein